MVRGFPAKTLVLRSGSMLRFFAMERWLAHRQCYLSLSITSTTGSWVIDLASARGRDHDPDAGQEQQTNLRLRNHKGVQRPVDETIASDLPNLIDVGDSSSCSAGLPWQPH